MPSSLAKCSAVLRLASAASTSAFTSAGRTHAVPLVREDHWARLPPAGPVPDVLCRPQRVPLKVEATCHEGETTTRLRIPVEADDAVDFGPLGGIRRLDVDGARGPGRGQSRRGAGRHSAPVPFPSRCRRSGREPSPAEAREGLPGEAPDPGAAHGPGKGGVPVRQAPKEMEGEADGACRGARREELAEAPFRCWTRRRRAASSTARPSRGAPETRAVALARTKKGSRSMLRGSTSPSSVRPEVTWRRPATGGRLRVQRRVQRSSGRRRWRRMKRLERGRGGG
jgi:hypothetical protein